MPPNEPAESMVPAKNARFSGAFDRCTCASSSRVSSSVHLKAFATTAMFSGLVVAQAAVALENAVHQALRPSPDCALAKPLFTASTSAIDQQVAVGHQHLGGAIGRFDRLHRFSVSSRRSR